MVISLVTGTNVTIITFELRRTRNRRKVTEKIQLMKKL